MEERKSQILKTFHNNRLKLILQYHIHKFKVKAISVTGLGGP
jgi:hypothetical protein